MPAEPKFEALLDQRNERVRLACMIGKDGGNQPLGLSGFMRPLYIAPSAHDNAEWLCGRLSRMLLRVPRANSEQRHRLQASRTVEVAYDGGGKRSSADQADASGGYRAISMELCGA